MTFLQAVLLGVVEGVSEFLPISSTAHLILASSLLRIQQTEFLKTFEIAIQSGAILSVVVLYARAFARRFDVWAKIIVAFIPTGVLGFLLHGVVKRHLLGNVPVVLWALFLGGLALIVFERFHREKEDAASEIEDISYGRALLIGVFQALAMVPGVSRSAATITGGLLLGIRRKTIVDFSFLLAVPTMAAATGYDLLKSAGTFQASDLHLLAAGFITSFVVALLSIVWLLRFIRRHSFVPFGVYRIALAGVFLALLFAGLLS
ncbi:MAG: undecaprenyl-diphosphate phosphatase [Candidatus Peribacteraceae bacterium]|nr:undecaprenyl-diphosphate phosphatase [Candidatus Peribacteraceae bacterium]